MKKATPVWVSCFVKMFFTLFVLAKCKNKKTFVLEGVN
jgi:hypothetical protein